LIETLYVAESETARDNFNLAAVIVEYGLVVATFIAIAAGSMGPFVLHNTTVHLSGENLTLIGAVIKRFSGMSNDLSAPLSGFGMKPKETVKEIWSLIKENLDLFALTIAGGVGVIGGDVAGTIMRQSSLTGEEEKQRAALNAL
jgi:hypothetical protein